MVSWGAMSLAGGPWEGGTRLLHARVPLVQSTLQLCSTPSSAAAALQVGPDDLRLNALAELVTQARCLLCCCAAARCPAACVLLHVAGICVLLC